MHEQKLAFISALFLVILVIEALCAIVYSIFSYYQYDRVKKQYGIYHTSFEKFLYFILISLLVKTVMDISYMYY